MWTFFREDASTIYFKSVIPAKPWLIPPLLSFLITVTSKGNEGDRGEKHHICGHSLGRMLLRFMSTHSYHRTLG